MKRTVAVVLAGVCLSALICARCGRFKSVLVQSNGPKTLGESDRPSGPAVCVMPSGETAVAMLAADPKDPRKTMLSCFVMREGGRSWTVSHTMPGTLRFAADLVLHRFRDGTLVLIYSEDKSKQIETGAGFHWLIFSGQEWTFKETGFVPVPGFDFVIPSHEALELGDGKLLLPATLRKTGGIESVCLLVFEDQGRDLNGILTISSPEEAKVGFLNPTVNRLEDGRLLCVMETSGANGTLYQSVSDDSGKTWPVPVSIGIYGRNPDWMQDPSGTLFLAFDDDWPKGIGLARSYQFGTVWEKEISLYPGANAVFPPRLVRIDSASAAAFFFARGRGQKAELLFMPFYMGKTKTPRGFSVSANGRGEVKLRWNRVSSADYYFVYRGMEPDFEPMPGYPFAGNAVATAVRPEYTDVGLDSGKTFFYRVSAVAGTGKVFAGSGGESDPTAAFSVTIR